MQKTRIFHASLVFIVGFSLSIGMAPVANASDPFTNTLTAEGEFEVGVPTPEFTYTININTVSMNHVTSFVLEPSSDPNDPRSAWVLDRQKLISKGCTDISTAFDSLTALAALDPSGRADFPTLFSTPDKCGLTVSLSGNSYFPADATPNNSEYSGSGASAVVNNRVRAFIGAGNQIYVVFLQIVEDPSAITFTVDEGVYTPVAGRDPRIRIRFLVMQVGTVDLPVPITVMRYLPIAGGSYGIQSVPVSLAWPGTVTFDPTDGSGTMADFYAEGTVALPPNTFSRAGYSFAGWALSLQQARNGNVMYTDGALFTAEGDLTLYAVWVPTGATSNSSSNQLNSRGDGTAEPALHLDLSHSLGRELSQASALIEGEGLGKRAPYSLVFNQTRGILADGKASTFGSFSKKVGLPTTLSAGRYSVTLSSIDSAGNNLTLTQWFQVDASGVIVSVDGVLRGGLAQTGVSETLHSSIFLAAVAGALGLALVSWSRVPVTARSRADKQCLGVSAWTSPRR